MRGDGKTGTKTTRSLWRWPHFSKRARHALTLDVGEHRSHLTSLITICEIAMLARSIVSVRHFETLYARFQQHGGAPVRA
jgi:hypothetical protein